MCLLIPFKLANYADKFGTHLCQGYLFDYSSEGKDVEMGFKM